MNVFMFLNKNPGTNIIYKTKIYVNVMNFMYSIQ